MSIISFLRIIWARKLLVAAVAASCLVGALFLAFLLPPRWEAHTRVMLNSLKPDPITGLVISGPSERTYAATQIELITDYSVAGQVPQKLGWQTDPRFIDAYGARGRHDQRDFSHWAAQIIIDGTKAKLLEGSNILEIAYTAPDPHDAKAVADAVRDAYMGASLAFRRADALHNAQWYQQQAESERQALNQAQAVETSYERQNNLLMADNKTDVDTARLRALSAQAAPVLAIAPQGANTQVASQLAELDAEITQAREKLGPNHPEFVALKAKRDALASVAVRERAQQSEAASAAAAQAHLTQQAVEVQKTRIIGESDKLAHLQQLQADVDAKTDQLNKTLGRIVELQQEASVADSGIIPLGVATTGKQPAFPNKPLIIGGSIGLGLALGVMIALLAELMGRRVRSATDLREAAQAPLLAVVPASQGRAPGLGASGRVLNAQGQGAAQVA